jgi:tetratricopeptide (TPR) repeat protein
MLKKFSGIATVFFVSFFASCASAEIYSSNADLINDIEKSLLFDKQAREKIDVYKTETSSKKSAFTINAGDSTDKTKSNVESSVEIFVTNPKAQDFDIRQKEKIAYNAALAKQDEVALELYKQVLASEPDNDYAKFSLAVIYQKLGQYSQAKKLYRELLKSSSDGREQAVGNLISILIEESPREAVYMLLRLSLQNPDAAEVFAKLAIAYDKIKDYDNAVIALKNAVRLSPQDVEYKYNLAVAYDKTNQKQQALENYLNVVKSYSSSANPSISISQVQGRIESLRAEL